MDETEPQNVEIDQSESAAVGGGPIEILPFEILQRVLMFVRDSDLLKCSLVCRLWQQAIVEQSFWKQKCQHTGRYVEEFMAPYYPEDWRDFYLKSPFTRNLIKNCSGQDSTGERDIAHWDLLNDGGHRWKVETDCPGSGALPEELLRLGGGKPNSFATSFGWCEREQVIDLVAEGIPETILDGLRPAIFISEWYAPRFDCGNVYEFGVELLKGRLSDSKQDVMIDSFTFGPLQTPQWADRNWKQATHTFKDYAPGLRYIRFWDKSKDSQFWAGHYGGKMAGSEVRFLIGQPPAES